ncbi:MAG: 23S rRNA (uracil(1939)-C(5))-methyltransferase RlmD [Alkaliphilus sp.]|nr:MAG: 23S rRNA (uracil(1939)-C(5))-methyltransferase RlmD [Alkaliphilus sp.]
MIEKGKIYNVQIENIGNSGEGVGRIDGLTVFVESGIPKDDLRIKITTLKKKYGVGEIVEILKPSPHRIVPICNIANKCGGCQIMNMEYAEQLNQKRKKVKETLKRIGKIDAVVHNTIGMENPYLYRNKAQFPIGTTNGKVEIGFFEKGTHSIVDTSYCHIQHTINESIVKTIREYVSLYNVSVYNEKTKKGALRHVITRVGFNTGEVMVVLVTNTKELPYQNELIEILRKNIVGLKSIVHNLNNKATNIIFGEKTQVIFGSEKIMEQVADLKFKISAQSFFQVNSLQTEVLYKKVLEFANLDGSENVFDLYCGTGSISLFLAKKAKKVYGIEIVEKAINDARENALLNQITNAEFFAGDAGETVEKLYDKGITADIVVVDPPRRGCDERLLSTIIKMKPQKIIYVSCNPATLARDLEYLCKREYEVLEVQPVDMFPHTSHIETVSQIIKRR